MLINRTIAVLCFAMLFVTAAGPAQASGGGPSEDRCETRELGHHSDKPWDTEDVSCGR